MESSFFVRYCSLCLMDVLPQGSSTLFTCGFPKPSHLHDRQIADPVGPKSNAMLRRPIFGLVFTYNRLPQELVDARSTKHVQKGLQNSGTFGLANMPICAVLRPFCSQRVTKFGNNLVSTRGRPTRLLTGTSLSLATAMSIFREILGEEGEKYLPWAVSAGNR